jgi:hypothetical protein
VTRLRGRASLAFIALFAFGYAGGLPPARADVPYVHEGFVLRSTTAARVNPLGLSSFFRIGYQHRLLGDQENILLQSTYVGLNAVTTITAAYARVGARLDIQPLAILRILVGYEFIGLFGTFDALQSFRDISEDFSDARQSERTRAGLAHATTGGIFTVSPILQARLGPITVVSTTEFIRNQMSVPAGDQVYFDLPYSMLAPRAGWLFGNETDVTYKTSFGFSFGVRNGIYHAFYPATAVAGDRARAAAITPIVRVGPLFGYQFFESKGPARFKDPSIFLNTAIWVRDPYRTGQAVSQLVPYVVLGFTFVGEL